MKRWIWKRWAWAGVFGITAAVGLAMGAGKDAPPRPPQVGDVKVLNFEKGPEKKVKVQKVEKQPDGSYLLEVKDTKSGEVFSLLDRTAGGATGTNPSPAKIPQSQVPAAIRPPLTTKSPVSTKAPAASTGEFSASARSRFSDPLLPSSSPPAAEPARRVFNPNKPAPAAAPTPMPEPAPEKEKKPGLLGRIFGKKKKDQPDEMPKPPSIPNKPSTVAPPISPRPAPAFVPSTPVGVQGPGATRPAPQASTSGKPKLFPDYPGAMGESRRTATPQPAAPTSGKPQLFPAYSDPLSGSNTTATPQPAAPASGKPQSFPAYPGPLGESRSATPPVAKTPEPPRMPVTPPVSVFETPVTPPTKPPMSAPAPLPIPTPPVAIPTPAVPLTPVPSIPVTQPPVAQPPVARPPIAQPPVTTPTPKPPMETPSLPVPSVPVTPAPVIPTIPSGPSGLPTIPVPPSGVSMSRQPVVQAGFATQAAMALAQDIQPHVTALRTAMAPSSRAMAARALAGGRHASSETVKSILFMACTSDPSSFVRASCIHELCKLGYYDPAFMAYLSKATGDPSEDVRTAAKEAMAKMTPQK